MHLICAISVMLIPTSLAARPENRVVRQWVFDKPDDLLGWTPALDVTDVAVRDGAISLRTVGSDPQLLSPLFDPFKASNSQAVEITWDCSGAGTGEFFFTKTTEGEYGGLRPSWRTVVYVERSGDQVTVVRPFWQALGKIIRFRIDPPNDVTIRLKRVRVIETTPATRVSPQWDFASNDADAWLPVQNVASIRVDHAALSLTSSAPEAIALAAVTPTPAEKFRYLSIEFQAKDQPLVSLCWAGDKHVGLSRIPLSVEESSDPQVCSVDLKGAEGWQGNITHLGVGFASAAGQELRIRRLSLTEEPTGPARLQCRYFGSVDTIIRPARPAAMQLWLKNVGAAPHPATTVKFLCPQGLKIQPERAPVPACDPAQTIKVPCELRASTTGDAVVKIQVGDQSYSRTVTVAPAVPQTKAAYVPIPHPIETTHAVGIYYFPGWSPEQTQRWSYQLDFPERRPLLGFYREGDPAVADWHIKWAVENGIQLFIYDWYWRDGKEYIPRGLNEGFLRARYRNLIDFCVMWANHENFASHTPQQLLTVTDYWAKNYWQLRNYRRHDGKPVVVFFAVDKLTEYLGSVEKVHAAFEAMRARAKQLGFPGIWFVGCGGRTTSEQQRLKAMGFDACSAYNYAGAGAATKHSPYEILMSAHEAIWRTATDAAVIPYIPLLTTGWDSRPWHHDQAMVRYGRTPAKWEQGLRLLHAFLTKHHLPEGWLEAWNEWGEGSYIEPNVKFGFADLEAIRTVFGKPGQMPPNIGPRDVGLGPYDIEMFRKDYKKQEIRVKTQGLNPNVNQGLDVLCDERSVTLTAGSCRVGDKLVAVKETTLDVDPAESVAVNDEVHPISDERPMQWHGGTRLIAGRQPFRVMPGQLTPNSLLIQAKPQRTALCYEQDKDYFLDEYWGALCRLPQGRIQPKQPVPISYVYGMRRVDRIEILPDGTAKLIRGTPKVDCPAMPPKTPGATTLATIYRPYHARYVTANDVFVVNEPKAAERPTPSTAPVAKTLAKLRAGQPVTIVCWGDSVTVGGDASCPEKRYVDLFATRIRQRFPKSKIIVINAGIGGTSTHGRLKDYEKEVLAHKPDLITVEFVNDMGLPKDVLLANWRSAIAQARQAGSEFVIITPHFVMPLWMGKPYSRGPEIRPNCLALRQLAAEEKVGLADAARRWELLEYEGIPYEILLMNGINHPDDRGHELFVEELMRLFPS